MEGRRFWHTPSSSAGCHFRTLVHLRPAHVVTMVCDSKPARISLYDGGRVITANRDT
jgi:hypothetical protein